MKVKNKRFFVVLSIVIAILGFQILWYVNYTQFRRPDGYELAVNDYYKNFDGYTVSYHSPEYPKFTGNYAISDNEDKITIILWPETVLRRKPKFGVSMYNDENEIVYLINVDENLKYIEGENNFDIQEKKIVLSLLKTNEVVLNNFMKILLGEINPSRNLK